jgi:ATP-dependent DNA ligase
MDTPTFIEPMAARVVTQLPEGEGWAAYDVKLDGYGALIRSRNNPRRLRRHPRRQGAEGRPAR